MVIDQFWHGTLRRPYRLHTATYGDDGKPVIVLLHGIAASGEDWHALIPLLTPHYHCITIDLLGFGRSPKPQWAGYSMEEHLRSIRRTIRSLRLPWQYTLVGHSLGSLLATRYVRRYPDDVERLVLLSPPVYPALDTIEGKLALRRTDLLMRVYRIVRGHPRMTPDNVRRLSKLGAIPHTIAAHPDTWVPFKRSLQRCIEQQTIAQDIREIRVPIDAMYGTLDAVVVGANVRALARLRDVDVHTFTGNHALGHAYAKATAKLLVSKTLV
ncbi:MAG TPA: alpha/beta fold hydrolase [Candidatus Saccharimonadales bacterium]|jgi:pimeloyl-ACP methyl ester carboxylesterase